MARVLLAVCLITTLTVSCGDSALKYYNLGVEAAQRDDVDEAIGYWRKSVEQNPSDPDTRYNLGMALLEKKQYAEAEENFLAAARINSEDYQLQYGLGRAQEMQGKYADAKKAYRYSINLKPNYHPPFTGLAKIALRQDLYSTAEKYATEALRFAPLDGQANLALAEAYYMQQNHQAAYAQLISARAWLNNEPEYLLLLGKVLNARHMYSDAMAVLLKAKDAGLTGADLYLSLGKASFETQDLRQAEEYYRLSLYRDDSNVETWTGLARTCYERNELDKSLEAWNRASALDPEDSEIDLGIAMVHIRAKRFEQAVSVMEKMGTGEDVPPRMFYYLGHSLMRVGRPEEAKEAFESFLDRWQGDPGLADEVREVLTTL